MSQIIPSNLNTSSSLPNYQETTNNFSTVQTYSATNYYEPSQQSMFQNNQQQFNYFPFYTGSDYQQTSAYYYDSSKTYQNEYSLAPAQYPSQFLPQNSIPNGYKSATPPPAPFDYQTSAHSELTPEKLMNDSGIDLISPTLVNQMQQNQPKYNTSSNDLTISSQINISASTASPDTHKPAVQSYTQSTERIQLPQISSQTASISSDSEDEDEEDDENEEESSTGDKENKKPAVSSKGNPKKPPKPYLEIIADAILTSDVKMMQLHEIYHLMEKKYLYFAKNINKSWRNSVRHNLSLNECFVKAGRGTNGKGNYWKIHPLCEKEFIRGNFRRKSFKQLIRAGSSIQAQSNVATQQRGLFPASIDFALNYNSAAGQTLPSSHQYPIPSSTYHYNFFNPAQFNQHQQVNELAFNSKRSTEPSNTYNSFNNF